jgi:FAD/FMN-containing dehydrogenase
MMEAIAAAESRSSLLGQLGSRLSGRLLRPTDPDYLAWALSANTRFDSVLPVAVALCASEADVRETLRAAALDGLPIAVRAGGHNYIGMSSTNGLLIVTRLMRAITVDEATGRAVVGAGAINGELIRELRTGGWMLPIGTCPNVGVAGLTLGGGVGDNTRWAGLTCDHLVSTRAIDANGETLLVDARNNPDLYWASQGGGGGNFALHTDLTFQLLRAPPRVSYFAVEYSGRDASARALATLDGILHAAPDFFSAFAFIRTSPRTGQSEATPWQLDAKSFPNVEIVGSMLGTPAELRDLVMPLIDLGPAMQVFGEGTFWQAQDWLAVPPGMRHGWADVNRYMARPLAETEIDAMMELLLRAPYGRADRYVEFGLFGWAGGAVRKRGPTDSAYVHRNATNMLRAGASWNMGVPQADQLALSDWLDQAFDLMRGFAEPSSYMNWPSEKIKDWQAAYYGANLDRLRGIKRRYDPRNVFTSIQSISPA